MTPGIHASNVNNTLIKKVAPSPCFRNTANGGSKMLRMIVNSDICIVLVLHKNHQRR